jgi:hypothetical protein
MSFPHLEMHARVGGTGTYLEVVHDNLCKAFLDVGLAVSRCETSKGHLRE